MGTAAIGAEGARAARVLVDAARGAGETAPAAARARNASSSLASTSRNILSFDWSAFLSCSSPCSSPRPTSAGRGGGADEGGRSLSGGSGVGVMRPSGMGAGGSGFGVASVGEGAFGGIAAGSAQQSTAK